MEPTQPLSPVVTSTKTSSPGIFGTNIPASVAFLVAIVLFLLPFAEIKCGGVTIANQTGVGFVTNQEWKSFDKPRRYLESAKPAKEDEFGNSQLILIVVLVLALIGFLVSVTNTNGMIAVMLGLLSACGLIYFLFDLKSNFDASVHKDAIDQAMQSSRELGNTFNSSKPTLSFAPAFWISLLALLAAVFFSWQRRKVKHE